MKKILLSCFISTLLFSEGFLSEDLNEIKTKFPTANTLEQVEYVKTKKELELKKLEDIEKTKAEKLRLQHEQEISKQFTIEELVMVGLEMPQIMLQSVIKAGDLELIEAIPLISNILLDETKDLELRKNCIFALNKIQHEKIVPVLEKAVNSSDPRISFISKKSLMSLKFKTLKK